MQGFDINKKGKVIYISKTEKKSLNKLYILAIVLIVLAIINIAETFNSIKVVLDKDKQINTLENRIEEYGFDLNEELKEQGE